MTRRDSVSWSSAPRDTIPLLQEKRAAKEKRRDEARQRELEQRPVSLSLYCRRSEPRRRSDATRRDSVSWSSAP